MNARDWKRAGELMGIMVAANKRAGREWPMTSEATLTQERVVAHQEDRHCESPVSPHRPDLRGYLYLSLMVLLGSTTSPFAMVAVRELPVGDPAAPAIQYCRVVFNSLSLGSKRSLATAPRGCPPAGPGRCLLRPDQPELFPQRDPLRPQLSRWAFFTRPAPWSSGSWRGCLVMRRSI